MDKYKDDMEIEKFNEDEWQRLSASSIIPNKNLGKVYEISSIVEEIDADIYMLCEVGGFESLYNFNKYFLSDKYNIYIEEGNDVRGISCGYLVNKRIKYDFKVRSNKKFKLDNNRNFTRDLLSLDFEINNERYRLLMTHLKSLISSSKDPNGLIQRTREIKGLCKIYDFMTVENIILAGDFNSDIYEADEFKPLLETDFKDIHKIIGSSKEERTTSVFFNGVRYLHQLDYIMLNDGLNKKVKSAYTYRYKTSYGDIMGLPENRSEKQFMPSDHYPLVVDIDI